MIVGGASVDRGPSYISCQVHPGVIMIKLRSSGIALALVLATTLGALRAAPAPLPQLRVVKSASCGCCAKWVDYMKKQGFAVTVEEKDEFTALKRSNGVTRELE